MSYMSPHVLLHVFPFSSSRITTTTASWTRGCSGSRGRCIATTVDLSQKMFRRLAQHHLTSMMVMVFVLVQNESQFWVMPMVMVVFFMQPLNSFTRVWVMMVMVLVVIRFFRTPIDFVDQVFRGLAQHHLTLMMVMMYVFTQYYSTRSTIMFVFVVTRVVFPWYRFPRF